MIGRTTNRTGTSGNEKFDYLIDEYRYINFMFYQDGRMASIGL